MKLTKQGTFKVRRRDKGDSRECLIEGIAVTKSGQRLIVDRSNRNIKLLSPNMKQVQSLVKLETGFEYDITVISDQEAVVTSGRRLFILEIIENNMRIKRMQVLQFHVLGISIYRDKLIVTCTAEKPPSVKLIDQFGEIFWSTLSDQDGNDLFVWNPYVSCYDDGKRASVVVTDVVALTLLDGDTGNNHKTQR